MQGLGCGVEWAAVRRLPLLFFLLFVAAATSRVAHRSAPLVAQEQSRHEEEPDKHSRSTAESSAALRAAQKHHRTGPSWTLTVRVRHGRVLGRHIMIQSFASNSAMSRITL